MADAYRRYGDGWQMSMAPPAGKRSRSDYDVPAGHGLPGYFSRDDERDGPRVIRDTHSIGASYDRYLRSGQIPSLGAGDSGRSMAGHPADDPRMLGAGVVDPGVGGMGRAMGFGGGRPPLALPPDASNTLYVEGLPANCTRREVSHIFRPFVGFKEARLVIKEGRNPGGDPLVLCFVDFSSPSHAATALDILQVCRHWKDLASDNALWSNLFKERWGLNHVAFFAPLPTKSWKNVYEVQDRCDRVGLGLNIIREGTEYYIVHQGEIQRYLGSRKDVKGVNISKRVFLEEGKPCLGILDKILFFIGDLDVATRDAKRIRV